MKVFKKINLTIYGIVSAIASMAQNVSSFEELTLSPNSYWNGFQGANPGGFSNGNAFFPNDTSFGYWTGGFAYSNKVDKTTAGYLNDQSAITGKGVLQSQNYIVGQSGSFIKLKNEAIGKAINGFYVTNSTYAYLSMTRGDQFAKIFGGKTGNDPDYFKMSIIGYRNGLVKTDTVHFYLADFRSDDNSKDYIINTWRWVNTLPLGDVDSIKIKLSSSDNSFGYMNTPAYFCIDNFNDNLFASKAGAEGSAAIFKDNSAIKAWAINSDIKRGFQSIANKNLGFASFGNADTSAIGPAGTKGIVSLGDSGIAVLTFNKPITNGPGADFAVFENGFEFNGLEYLELAFVEVSSNGVDYVRFPAVYNYDVSKQLDNFGLMDSRYIHNLAGKYVANYGTPFDLDELKGSSNLDVNSITHVKIIDVIGSLNPLYNTKDSNGNPINDPWPTASGASGFDLDAVGVINERNVTGIDNQENQANVTIYPNPAIENIQIALGDNSEIETIQLIDAMGNLLRSEYISRAGTISLTNEPAGVYFIKIRNRAFKFVKQ